MFHSERFLLLRSLVRVKFCVGVFVSICVCRGVFICVGVCVCVCVCVCVITAVEEMCVCVLQGVWWLSGEGEEAKRLKMEAERGARLAACCPGFLPGLEVNTVAVLRILTCLPLSLLLYLTLSLSSTRSHSLLHTRSLIFSLSLSFTGCLSLSLYLPLAPARKSVV